MVISAHLKNKIRFISRNSKLKIPLNCTDRTTLRQYGIQGRIQDFKLGVWGAHLKKLRRAKGGAKIFGIFRVKNHDFTPKNHIFPGIQLCIVTIYF